MNSPFGGNKDIHTLIQGGICIAQARSVGQLEN